jgi:hypothetical protein
MPVVRISKDTAERLDGYKDGPLDTMGAVIGRLLDQVEGSEPPPTKGGRQLKIAREPRMTAMRNKESWARIQAVVTPKGQASFENLVNACATHNHHTGGRGFVEYCLDNGWLEYAD